MNLLYDSAKATAEINAAGWRTLAASVRKNEANYVAGQVNTQVMYIFHTDSTK